MNNTRLVSRLLVTTLCLSTLPLAFAQTTPAPATSQDQTAQPAAAAPAPAQVAATNMVERAAAPTESDMYCSGYITPHPVSNVQHLVGGWETPNQSLFSQRDYVYLTGGAYEPGQKYQILRPVKDPNDYEAFKGQHAAVRKLGQTYQELGRVNILGIEKNIAIGTVEFSCDGFAVGDIAIPWPERPAPKFRAATQFNRWAPDNGRQKGRIVQALGFDMVPGQRQRVYLDIGDNKGVKTGDYFRVTRTYESGRHEAIESQNFQSPPATDATRMDTPKFDEKSVANFPRRSVAELIVLYTTPTSSTAMITSNIDAVNVGDYVEMEEEMAPPPPPAAAVMRPPTISCSASPATVRVGERSTIGCTGASEDGRPLTFTFTSNAGNISSREGTGMLDTRTAQPGVATVTTTVSDDRNMTASATTPVTIEAPPPAPQASKMAEFMFKPNGTYVDNAAKAILDQVALRLQGEPNSTVELVDSTAAKEAARLGATRANNAKIYLTKNKGVDATRVTTADAGNTGNRKVEVWFVPAGATAPAITPATATPQPK